MARWVNVWDAAGNLVIIWPSVSPRLDKLRQRLMSSGDELATATAHYGDDSRRTWGQSLQCGQ